MAQIMHFGLEGGSSQMTRCQKSPSKAINEQFSYPLNTPPSRAQRQIVVPNLDSVSFHAICKAYELSKMSALLMSPFRWLNCSVFVLKHELTWNPFLAGH